MESENATIKSNNEDQDAAGFEHEHETKSEMSHEDTQDIEDEFGEEYVDDGGFAEEEVAMAARNNTLGEKRLRRLKAGVLKLLEGA